ncbi:uncharacterized protein LOC143920272 [Arctopsyche grandis]|uniref:uncharacterized protein LOC143920272 n=1 Tax=Arctopsyche grandis TaxID=121162 RepID=UPI00406D85F5
MKTENGELKEVNHHKKELLVNLLWDCLLYDKLPSPLASRVKDLMAYWDLLDSIKTLNAKCPESANYTPMGIELKPEKLTLNEKKTIQAVLEKKICDTYPDLLEKFDKFTNGEIKNKLKHGKSKDTALTAEHNKIVQLCTVYQKRLEDMHNINIELCHCLKEWIDLRLGVAATRIERRAELCNQKSKINELKAKLINVQLKRFVYGGTTAIRDYMEYYLSMKEKFDDYKKEIYNYTKILRFDNDDEI